MLHKSLEEKREHNRLYLKKWRRNHPLNTKELRDKWNEKMRGYKAAWKQKIKLDVFSYYGNGKIRCALCGHDKMTSLSIDHINGDGANHRRAIGINTNFYSWLIKNHYPEGYRILCMNCQFDERVRIGKQNQGFPKLTSS